MKDVNSLIQKLSWDTPLEEKEDAIEKLQLITDKDLHLLLQPLYKDHWDGAAEVVTRLGYPRVKSIIPGLLKWIQDLNWPGANQIAVFLSEIGDPIIPFIKDVFNHHSDDGDWIAWIFEIIIDNWNKDQISQIQVELIQMSKGKINDLRSIRILLDHGIYQNKEVLLTLEEKKKNLLIEIMDLDNLNPGIDCGILKKGFNEVIFKPELSRHYYEQNKKQFSYCNYKSYLQEYLSDIEGLISEVSYIA